MDSKASAVAVKILAINPYLKQRFEREAKTLAALSHPHICPIHDVGCQDGIHFLSFSRFDLPNRWLSRGVQPSPEDQVEDARSVRLLLSR